MKKRFLIIILFGISPLFYFIYLSSYSAIGLGLNNNTNWTNELKGSFHSSLVLGDINNDGRPDLISGGCLAGSVDTCSTSDTVRVYFNNGTAFYENATWEQNLTNITFGSLTLGDIDNDGDLDLIRAGNINTTYGFIRVYLNNGTSFEENQTWEQNFSGITNAFGSSVALGDIDDDGRLDLALIGTDSTSKNGVYINNGTAFEKNSTWLASLPLAGQGGGNGALAFGDVDNDGRLDLVMAGSRYTNWYRAVYINNGTSLVENSTWEVYYNPIFGWPSLILGDYDNDGDLDLMAIGAQAGDHYYIYENNGSTFLINETEKSKGSCCLGGYYAGSLHMGDYDSDGYLDSVVMGRENGRDYVFRNYYTNTSQDPYNVVFYGDDNASDAIHRDDLQRGSLAWSDFDNDTHLDTVITGFKGDGSGAFSYVYINNNTINNTFPNPPNSSFSAIYENNRLNLGWGNGSDNETPTAGLYYNLRVGTASGGNQIVSGIYGGSSNPTAGYFGNMMQRKNISLGGGWLENDTTYYWSVQTIDTGFAKSSWSGEQIYTTAGDITYPVITLNDPQDSNYTSFSNITFNATASDNTAISNVSLYGSWGGWHRNQTNSSGLNGTNYIFQVNLSDYPEGTYTWTIHACDSTGNCLFSPNRTVIRDLTAPLIALESPANASVWTANNSVSFNFNVTDLAIANCSLIIGSSLKYNFSSVAVNATTNATIELENGIYNWSVNCTDMLLRQNSSEPRQLTVDYQALAPTSGGGSSGGGASYLIYSMGELKEAQEINKELKKGDKINFNLDSEGHNLTISKITKDNATIEINSTIARFTLGIGESRMLNLSGNEYYDFYVRLNSIANLKADITIRRILEVITPKIKEEPKENTTEDNISSQQEPEEQTEKKSSLILPALGYAAGAAIIAGLFFLYMKLRKRNLA